MDNVATLLHMGDMNHAEVKRRIGDMVCLKYYIDLYHVIRKCTPEIMTMASTVDDRPLRRHVQRYRIGYR